MNLSRVAGAFVRICSPVTKQILLKPCNRLFFTSVLRMEELKQNPYFSKYADKIKKLQEEKPEEFDSKVNAIAEKHKKDLEQKRKDIEDSKPQKEATQIKPKSLDEFMKVDLIKDKSSEEIEQIWIEYHKGKDYIFGVIPKEEYEVIKQKAGEYGTFIYPVPRGEGYEFFLQQFSANTINFTPLIMYQTHKDNAPSCLTITHYEDLLEDKGIVLMHGEPDMNVLGIHEAQMLAVQVKMYYGIQSGLKFNHVRVFNTSPDTFRYMDLIKQFENLKKDVALSKENKESKIPAQKKESQ